jgi:trimethylamine:corrinoid methyltransferase-like protein
MIADFDNFDLQITMPQARRGFHSGDCDEDIKALLSEPTIIRQFKKIDPESIKLELKEYGAWDEEELEDIEQNKARILWIACSNIIEEGL